VEHGRRDEIGMDMGCATMHKAFLQSISDTIDDRFPGFARFRIMLVGFR